MADKFKIAILGIGGVGGYIGAKLALQFQNADEIEICFIVRGENEKAIKANGLTLITPGTTMLVHPSRITADPAELGIADLIICCTKSYHLEDSIKSLKDCIDEKTVFLPLLNGVDAVERIRSVFPSNTVFEGCIYLISRITAPGVVEQLNKEHKVYFGLENYDQYKLKWIETIFRQSGIDASCKENIREICWEKFFFISTFASLSVYLDASIGTILANPASKEKLRSLMNELFPIAKSEVSAFTAALIDKTMTKLEALPPGTLPSLYRDFKSGGPTEFESITGYVVRLGKKLHIPTPQYDELYLALRELKLKN